ncbi:hypothetical protein ACFE04_021385 [Oxalis oulophora]
MPVENAAIVIQSHFKKLRDRRNYLDDQCSPFSANCCPSLVDCKLMSLHKQQLAATKIQSHCRRRILRMSFKSSKEEALVEEGAGAVSKSFQKGKEMVEESAEVAAPITGEALHKTKD